MNRKYKVIIFDYYGVLSTSLVVALNKCEMDNGLPRNFIIDLIMRNDPTKPSTKLIDGHITYTEFVIKFEKQVMEAAIAQDVQLPNDFSVQAILSDCMKQIKPNEFVLDSITNLKDAGYKICFLFNLGLIDGQFGKEFAKTKMLLRSICDYHFVSSEIGLSRPNPKFYEYALNKMGIEPTEAVSIEAVEIYSKIAESIGITAITIEDQPSVLKTLSELLEINFKEVPKPIPCTEDTVVHCNFLTKSGIKIHYVEKGIGPTVILCHGFPEFWYSWRYQIPFLARLGYRVIALDQRGFGHSDCPPKIEDYGVEQVTQDLLDLMDMLNLPQAVVIGHDWGSQVAWSMALHYPDRVSAVGSLNLGFSPAHPKLNLLDMLNKKPEQFDYVLYFQEEGVAEVELEKDINRSLRYILSDTTPKNTGIKLDTTNVRSKGGILVDLPEELPECPFMSDEDFNRYVEVFKKTGLRPGINWHRNIIANWSWDLKLKRKRIFTPAFLVTAEYDSIMTQELTIGMELFVPNLTREHLPCGHWIQIECPAELNSALAKWLRQTCPSPYDVGTRKN